MGRAQLGLNQGALLNEARAPLNGATQEALLRQQQFTLTDIEDILSDPFGMDAVKDIYFSLPPIHLRDLHVEVFGRESNNDTPHDRRYALQDLDGAVSSGGFPPDVVLGVKSPARQWRERVWTFDVYLDGSSGVPDVMNEFEFNRLVTALRRDLPDHIASQSVANPLEVTAICTVALGDYDFSREAFALSAAEARASCFSNLDSNSVTQRRFGTDYVAVIPTLPEFVPVPAGEAESFRNQVGQYVDLIIPAEFSVSANDDARTRTSRRYQLRATGPFTLQDRTTLETLWQWDDAEVEAATPQHQSWVEGGVEIEPLGPMLATEFDENIIQDTVFLLKLAAGTELDDRDWFNAMRTRRAVEMEQDRRIRQASRNGWIRGWLDPWPRFFPTELTRGDLSVFQDEFEQWNRARVASLPQQLVMTSWGLHGFPAGASPSVIGFQRRSSVSRPELDTRDVSIGERVTLRLPALVSDYRIDAPDGLMEQASVLEARELSPMTDVLMEVGDITLEDNQVIVEVRPTEVRFMAYDLWNKSDDVELTVQALDVAERAFGTVSAAIDPAPLLTGPIYWETIDLLRLRHTPSRVTDSDLQAMLERRFNAEKNDANTPQPHFFDLLDEVPNDPESRAQFLAWQQTRLGFLERPLVLRIEHAVVDPSFGSAITSFRSHGEWQVNTWFRGFHPSCQIERNSADLLDEVGSAEPEDARRMLACAAILQGREQLMSPAQVEGFLIAQRPNVYDQQFVFDLDKAALVSQAVLDARMGSPALDVTIRVTGASQLNSIEPLPAQLGEQIAGAIVAGEPIEAALAELEPHALAAPLTAFSASVQSIELVPDRGRGEPNTLQTTAIQPFPVDRFINELASITERESQANDESAMVAVPETPAADAVDASKLDILGLTIGMPVAEANAIIANHMEIGWTLIADRREQMMGAVGSAPGWSSGTMYVSESNREFIALYYEKDAPDFGLVGIMRWVFVQPQSVERARLGQALQQRYGNPLEVRPIEGATATGFLWTWAAPNQIGNCGYVPERSLQDIWQLDNPDAPFQPPFAIYDLTLPDLRTRPNVTTYLMSKDLQPDWLCPRTLSVRTSSVRPSFGLPADQSHAIVSILYDEQRAINTLRAAEAVRAMAGNTAQTSDGSADFEIDF